MTALQVLGALRELGVKVWVDGDRLQYSAPKGAMTEALRNDLAQHKAQITELLLKAAERDREGARTIGRVSRESRLPLSFAQQRLWFLDQLAPGNPFYNEFIGVRFSVPLNAVALEASLNGIVRRHEALRTTFVALDDDPVQCIAPSLKLQLTLVDLRDHAPGNREAEAVRLAANEAHKGFNLSTGPLLRAILIRLDEAEYAFVLVMHHIISDTWSMGIFFRELTELYQAFVMGRPFPLPELAIQYADFAMWQREWLKGGVRDAQLEYWKTQLADLPVLQLPTDRPRPAVQTFRGDRHPFHLPLALSSALKGLSKREGVTLFMTLLAAFQTLLHRFTRQDDIVVGSFIAGRNRAEIESLIGFFINTQVLRTDLTGDPTFVELLARVRHVAMDAYANQDLPFEMLVEELHPERDLSRNPLFQAVFQLQNVPATVSASSGSAGSTLEISRNTAIFDLVFHLWDGAQGIGGIVEYSTDLFDAPTIERMTSHFVRLLEGVSAEPGRRLSEFPLLSHRDRAELLTVWNDTAAEYPRDACIHELFERQVDRTPDAVAVIWGSEQVAYSALNARANRIAHYLRRHGIGPEVLVGVFMERSANMVVALLAVLKAGGAYVPLDPAYPKDRLAFMQDDAKPLVVLTERHRADRLPAYSGRVVCVDDTELVAGESSMNPDHLNEGALTPAYVIYTSGSSGKPKGVVGLHRGAVNRLCWMWNTYPFESGEVCCQKTSLSFVDSIWEIFGPLLQGVPLVMIPEETVKQPEELVETLALHRVTRFVTVPSLLSAMMEVSPELGVRLPHLRYWTSSGEALSQTVRDRFFGAVPNGVLLNLYGSSEVSADATWVELNAHRDSPWVAIGRPIANTQAYILDDRREPVPIGVPGELYIGGDSLARGYLDRNELSSERFVGDPFSETPGSRLYKTGDLARFMFDGNIVYMGRIDQQVKIRGFRIELEEIEAVLRQHASVRDVAIGVSEDTMGDKRLIAYVVQDQSVSEPLSAKSSDADQEDGWRIVWDTTYRETPELQDPTFNITGWNSIYTSLPIPADEMREWLDDIVERVLSGKPQRVLEIGCGVGLVLFRVAPHCTAYRGTDFSSEALSYLRKLMAESNRQAELAHVHLQQQMADEFVGIDPQSCDAVILNSVVQYFPNIDYLLRVLTGAVDCITSGGFIFVGDVRSLPLLRALHTSVELHVAPDSLPLADLSDRIESRIRADQELVIDPLFFHALRRHNPRITNVQVLMKRGRHHNELTRFRYDVVLKVEARAVPSTESLSFEWDEHSTIECTRNLLAGQNPQSVVISSVPNARLIREAMAVELLKTLDSAQTAGDLRQILALQPMTGIDPEEWFAMTAELGYSMSLDWSSSKSDGAYTVILQRSNADKGKGVPNATAMMTDRSLDNTPLSALVNRPRNISANRDPARALRAFAEQHLPDHMVPDSFVHLETLPRTPNGKLDRRALSKLQSNTRHTVGAYVAPMNPVEETLVQIWSDVLNVSRVGTRDNFFTELGGHSLIATRAIARIRDTFHMELPLRLIFEAPTVEGLAKHITDAVKDLSRERPAPIPRLNRENYRVRASQTSG